MNGNCTSNQGESQNTPPGPGTAQRTPDYALDMLTAIQCARTHQALMDLLWRVFQKERAARDEAMWRAVDEDGLSFAEVARGINNALTASGVRQAVKPRRAGHGEADPELDELAEKFRRRLLAHMHTDDTDDEIGEDDPTYGDYAGEIGMVDLLVEQAVARREIEHAEQTEQPVRPPQVQPAPRYVPGTRPVQPGGQRTSSPHQVRA